MVRQNAGYVKHKIDHFETTEDGDFLPAQGYCSSADSSRKSGLPFVRSTEGRYRCI